MRIPPSRALALAVVALCSCTKTSPTPTAPAVQLADAAPPPAPTPALTPPQTPEPARNIAPPAPPTVAMTSSGEGKLGNKDAKRAALDSLKAIAAEKPSSAAFTARAAGEAMVQSAPMGFAMAKTDGIGLRGTGAGGGGGGGLGGLGDSIGGRAAIGPSDYGAGSVSTRELAFRTDRERKARAHIVATEGEDGDANVSNGGTFKHAGVNPVIDVNEEPLSTFGADVDDASWMYARRFLRMGRAPTQASVRVEEFVNAMHYDYASPKNDAFAIHVDGAPSPFTRGMHVVRVALQAKKMTREERKPASIVFLVDVSGSMNQPDREPWVREGIKMAVDHLRADDRVAIATYAGASELVLPMTSAKNTAAIDAAIETLVPHGGTNMGSGMELAYREANKELSSDRSARVIVMSDGDANIGRTTHDSILASIKGYVSEGVTLSTVGFGSGNYNDVMMESLADAGNGNYTYIDSKDSLRRFFVDEMTNTLEVVAQDAKIQVEWNKNTVQSYRLLGYENRALTAQDFRNDKKDAGDIGAGHAVTALYEVQLRPDRDASASLGTVRVRHKVPRHEHATEESTPIAASLIASSTDGLDDDAKCALGMALGAEILRGSEHAAGLTLVDAAKLLRASAHGAHAGERREAAELFEKAPVQAVAVR